MGTIQNKGKVKIEKNLYVGMEVNYHSRIGGPVTTSGHKITHIERRNGEWIVFITGKTGFVSVEAISECKLVHNKDCELGDNWKNCPACVKYKL